MPSSLGCASQSGSQSPTAATYYRRSRRWPERTEPRRAPTQTGRWATGTDATNSRVDRRLPGPREDAEEPLASRPACRRRPGKDRFPGGSRQHLLRLPGRTRTANARSLGFIPAKAVAARDLSLRRRDASPVGRGHGCFRPSGASQSSALGISVGGGQRGQERRAQPARHPPRLCQQLEHECSVSDLARSGNGQLSLRAFRGPRGRRRRVHGEHRVGRFRERAGAWMPGPRTPPRHPCTPAASSLRSRTTDRRARAPGNRYSGTGVIRSLPIRSWCSRNAAVTTAQIVWLPRSSGPVRQHPSRKKPVMGSVLQESSAPPNTFSSAMGT